MSPSARLVTWTRRLASLAGCSALCAVALAGPSAILPLDARGGSRAAALAALCGTPDDAAACVRGKIDRLDASGASTPGSTRRALSVLARGVAIRDARTFPGPDELSIRYDADPASPDAVDPADSDGRGVPDVVEATALGLWQSRSLVTRQLELPRPMAHDVVLLELGEMVDGFLWPAAGGASTLVLDATPRDGAEGARRAAVRLYAYAVTRASSPTFPWMWGEAFAGWVASSVDGGPDPSLLRTFSRRARAMDRGFLDEDPGLATGNGLWLTFVAEAYGLSAIRCTIEELGRPQSTDVALDRALRRASGDDLASAFREFQLWTVLVGDRADGRHFRFADRLDPPRFATEREGLPALSVQDTPPVAPLGASVVRIAPLETDGGLRVRFEGDALAVWEADLLVVSTQGTLRRLRLPVSSDGQGEMTIPLPGVREALLLVRHLGAVDGVPHRFSFSAHREHGYPFELSQIDAFWIDDPTPGVLVVWETATEQRLVGFNVLRADAVGAPERVVNPVWIPALGSPAEATVYRFLDASADPRVTHVYRIEGLTLEGIAVVADAAARPATPAGD